jgi:ubiquinone/menaquinone biosynthesis C-methylase UbiE
MYGPVWLRRAAVALVAVVTAGALLQSTAARATLASVTSAQWHLDIERAMDAVGVAPGMVVGEAGAGDGYFTLPLARRVGPTGVVYANDISSRALRFLEEDAAKAGLTNIRTVAGDVADPRFPRRDLQLVVVVHAFHDFSRPVEWLVNLKAYLRPGGTVAIIDRDPAQGAESHFYSRTRIEACAAEAGYELTLAADDISQHLILVFRPVSRHSPGPRWPSPSEND